MQIGDNMNMIKKLFFYGTVLLLIGLGVIGILGYNQYREAIREVSIEDRVAQIKANPDYVPYEELSPYIVSASVAIEDHRFYQHHGIDPISIGRAFLTNLFQKDIVGGGSTITQQLAKNMYFDYDTSIIRKVSEVFVVHDLESNYTKEEILTFYVNIINYGDQHIGIKQASEGYFKVAPKDVTLEQATLIVGIPQSPSNYQLSDHYEQAVKRQAFVLEAMRKYNMLEEQ